MKCNQNCNQGRTCECADSHDDWIDEFWPITKDALLAINTCAAVAGLIGIVYELGTK